MISGGGLPFFFASEMRRLAFLWQQLLNGRTFQRAAGDPAVIVLRREQHPAFRLLAGDIGGAGLPLGVERVEFLL